MVSENKIYRVEMQLKGLCRRGPRLYKITNVYVCICTCVCGEFDKLKIVLF